MEKRLGQASTRLLRVVALASGLLLLAGAAYLFFVTLGGFVIGLGLVPAAIFALVFLAGLCFFSRENQRKMLVAGLCLSVAALLLFLLVQFTHIFENISDTITTNGIWGILSGAIFGALIMSGLDLIGVAIDNTLRSSTRTGRKLQIPPLLIAATIGSLGGLILSQSLNTVLGIVGGVLIFVAQAVSVRGSG